ncbi:MAG: hypothetical protein H6R14_2275 [Proteobacteria bacterium]|nr:hypothetical protein [Pseudomonadota bacterium]
MSSKRGAPSLVAKLEAAASAYQDAQVIPHCSVCAKPCCRLDALVLELNWKQVKVFWHLDESRATFDQRLSAGQGPTEIRAGNGLYYAHQKACPAYDMTARTCKVYGQAIKPAGCSDFPVYADGDSLTVDLRCEAVDMGVLLEWVADAVGPEFRVVHSADAEFPFLVAVSLRRAAGGAGGSKRPKKPGRK